MSPGGCWKGYGLRETIDAVADFEIHPALVDTVMEVILTDELSRDVGELDTAG